MKMGREAYFTIACIMAAIIKGCDQISTQVCRSSGIGAKPFTDKEVADKVFNLMTDIERTQTG